MEADLYQIVDNYNQIIFGVTKIVPTSRFLSDIGIHKEVRFIVVYIWIYLRCSCISRSGEAFI